MYSVYTYNYTHIWRAACNVKNPSANNYAAPTFGQDHPSCGFIPTLRYPRIEKARIEQRFGEALTTIIVYA